MMKTTTAAAMVLLTATLGCEGQGELGAFSDEDVGGVAAQALGVEEGVPSDQGEEPCACAAAKADAEAKAAEVVAIDLESPTELGWHRAPVTMTVFFDYGCPFSKRTAREVDKLLRDYGNDLRVVYAQSPLPMHESAELAAKAAIAAAEQSRFDDYHHALLASDSAYDRESLLAIAFEIGLDTTWFERVLDDPATQEMIESHHDLALTHDVRGRPTSFINGHRVEGNHVAQYRDWIEKELSTL